MRQVSLVSFVLSLLRITATKGTRKQAMSLGYDLHLEKLIACTKEDCIEIYDKAKELDRNVFVCHVLRYAPFFSDIKTELMTGKYGKISTINLTENVAYWH